MKHFLASIPLMCLVLLLLVGNSNIYAQQSAKQSKGKMLRSAIPISKTQIHQAGKKLSPANNKKRLEERERRLKERRALRASSKKGLKTGGKTQARSVQFKGKKKTLTQKSVKSLEDKVAEINANLETQGSSYRAVIADFKGGKVVKMQSLKPEAVYRLGN